VDKGCCAGTGQGRGAVLLVVPSNGVAEPEPLALPDELDVGLADELPVPVFAPLFAFVLEFVLEEEEEEPCVLALGIPVPDALAIVPAEFKAGSQGLSGVGSGVAVCPTGVVACGAGEAVLAGGVAVCGVGVAVCPGGVAVCPAGVAVCPAGVVVCPAGVAVCPAGVVVCPAGVVVCPAGVAVCPAGVAVCGVGDAVCGGGVAVCGPGTAASTLRMRLRAPAESATAPRSAVKKSVVITFNFIKSSGWWIYSSVFSSFNLEGTDAGGYPRLPLRKGAVIG